LSYWPFNAVQTPNKSKEFLFPPDLVNRVFSFGLAEFFQLDLWRTGRNTDTGAVVSMLTLATLQPNVLAFVLFSLGHFAYLTINISGGP